MGRVGEGGISEGQLRFRWFGHVQRRDSGYVGGEAGRQGEKKKATEMVYGWNQGGQKDGRCEMMHYGDPQKGAAEKRNLFCFKLWRKLHKSSSAKCSQIIQHYDLWGESQLDHLACVGSVFPTLLIK